MKKIEEGLVCVIHLVQAIGGWCADRRPQYLTLP